MGFGIIDLQVILLLGFVYTVCSYMDLCGLFVGVMGEIGYYVSGEFLYMVHSIVFFIWQS